MANPLTFDASGVTRHGYTGYEQVDEAGLIHMNGRAGKSRGTAARRRAPAHGCAGRTAEQGQRSRIYDPKLMRFVQADPIIQSPFDSQSYNRYTYVFNNPLAHTDPTGYWGKEEQGYLRAAVAIVITIYTGGTAAGASWGLLGTNVSASTAFAVTVVGGAAAGAVQTGTLKGAATGAISGAMFFGIGNYFDTAGWAHLGKDTANALSGTGHAAKTLAHGVAGGITAELGGGNFGNGFISAGVTQAFAPGIDNIDGGNAGFSVLRTVSAAAVGGTASALSGGKFANGAVTAAFARAFNDEANSHRVSVDRGLNPNGFDSPDDATLAAFARDEERYFELPRNRELLGAVVEITIGGANRYFPTTSIEVPANFRVSLSISGGGDTVALFHTHPAATGQEFFSPSDGSQARMSPFYVRTPSGDVRVLTGAMVNRELAGVRSAAARAAASYRGRSICAGGPGCLAPHPGEQ